MNKRPYCISELKDIDSDMKAKYRLSDIFAEHYPCLHRYRVKKGGRKERYIKDFGDADFLDDMTCSICFKLRTSSGDDVSSVDEQDGDPTGNGVVSRPPTTLYGLPSLKSSYTEDEVDEFCSGDGVRIDRDFLARKEEFYKWLYRHEYSLA